MLPGVAGVLPIVTASVWAVELPQVLPASTVILPAPDEGVAEILLVAEVPVQPLGKVQMYDVAPATVAMEYVVDIPVQTIAEPLIEPGAAGVADPVTVKV